MLYSSNLLSVTNKNTQNTRHYIEKCGVMVRISAKALQDAVLNSSRQDCFATIIKGDYVRQYCTVYQEIGEPLQSPAYIAECEILTGMGLAFFASAYADQADDAGQPLRGEILEQLPTVIDPSATGMASILAGAIAAPGLLLTVYNANTGGLTPRQWGHYAAMQAMGTGVGLWEYGIQLILPNLEFYGEMLSKDYF